MINNQTIKQQLIEEINNRIINNFPNEKHLTPLDSDMDNPNTIADYGVVARYIDEELYFMYWDVENIIISGENLGYYHSQFGRTLKNPPAKPSLFQKIRQAIFYKD